MLAPFSRALVGWHHQSLLGSGSRHCYGINYAHHAAAGVLSEMAQREPPLQLFPRLVSQVRHTAIIGVIIEGPMRNTASGLSASRMLWNADSARCRLSHGR